MLFCESESGEGACTARTTEDACETVARCGAATFAGGTVVVVAIADFERLVVICKGLTDASGAAPSSRLWRRSQ